MKEYFDKAVQLGKQAFDKVMDLSNYIYSTYLSDYDPEVLATGLVAGIILLFLFLFVF